MLNEYKKAHLHMINVVVFTYILLYYQIIWQIWMYTLPLYADTTQKYGMSDISWL